MIKSTYTKTDYQGEKSTLCTGCGHDSITRHIISAYCKSNINPYKVAKVSGIGCSSKTPAYFLKKSHGFNSLHGRMAPVATGAKLANQELQILGVSGDGDTASIGMGGFVHIIRRNLPMLYVIENNGVYGLTKGQFSATADLDSVLKSGDTNLFGAIDLCTLALSLGATFVGRSFSGDPKQLVPMIQAAIAHKGIAILDIISPCVIFNNHEGSTKSYHFVKENNRAFQELGFVTSFKEKSVDYKEGSTQEVKMHDGSILTLRKLAKGDLDLQDPLSAIQCIKEYKSKEQILTGIFYINTKKKDLVSVCDLTSKPLASLESKDLIPSKEDLKNISENFC